MKPKSLLRVAIISCLVVGTVTSAAFPGFAASPAPVEPTPNGAIILQHMADALATQKSAAFDVDYFEVREARDGTGLPQRGAIGGHGVIDFETGDVVVDLSYAAGTPVEPTGVAANGGSQPEVLLPTTEFRYVGGIPAQRDDADGRWFQPLSDLPNVAQLLSDPSAMAEQWIGHASAGVASIDWMGMRACDEGLCDVIRIRATSPDTIELTAPMIEVLVATETSLLSAVTGSSWFEEVVDGTLHTEGLRFSLDATAYGVPTEGMHELHPVSSVQPR